MAGEDKKDEKKSKKDMDVEAKINDIMMEGGKVVKMEVDYSESVAKKNSRSKRTGQEKSHRSFGNAD